MATPTSMSAVEPHRDRTMIVLAVAVALTLALAAVGMWATDMSIALASVEELGALALALAAVAAYCRWRRLKRLQAPVEIFLALLVASFGLLPISYLGMRFNLPLADDWLLAMDNAIGFDWPAFLHWVDAHPAIAGFFQVAYSSFGPQLMFLPVFFALVGATGRAAAVILGYILIVVVASIVAIWFPAHGAFVTHAVDASTLQSINAHFGYAFLAEFEQIRTAPAFVMSLDRVQGLLTFPSVHVAVAVLCLWAASGSRLLFVPFAILNIAMGLSAISHGGHYLVDVPAGMLVAVVAIAVGCRLFAGTGIATARQQEARTWTDLLAGLGRRPVRPGVELSPPVG